MAVYPVRQTPLPGMIFSVSLEETPSPERQFVLKNKIMKTDNRNSEKDLNANPDSKLNTNKPISKPDRFPESQQARDEMERQSEMDRKAPAGKKDDEIELLADDVSGTVSSRDTGSSPEDIAGVADLDRGMRRSRRK